MKLLFISTFLILLFTSCNNSIDEDLQEFEVAETIMAEVKADYEISWEDSNNAILATRKKASLKTLRFDSALLIHYWGYLIGDSSVKSHFPLNEKGQWISSILRVKSVLPNELHSVDSLLSDPGTFDPQLISYHAPKFCIIYYKEGKVIGQVSIGGGSESVAATIQLGNGKDFAVFRRKHFHFIHTFFRKHLY